MDQVLVKKRFTVKNILGIGLLCLLVGFAIYTLQNNSSEPTLQIDPGRITIATAEKGPFQEYIIETGEIVPDRTFFLDAIQGGNIVRVLKESGAVVQKREALIELENAGLRLEVLSQENALIEQINRVRTIRLQLDQNFLNHKKELAQIEHQLEILAPKFIRDSALYSSGTISGAVFEKTLADYRYNRKRLQFTYQSFRKDSTSRKLQLQQLEISENNMQENLEGVKKILDNLTIKAPITGLLATDQLQEGQHIKQGDRIGQIDILDDYKVRLPIDELYLPRIKKGLKATASIDGRSYDLIISYIYPTVTNGEFEVDMDFTTAIPKGIKSGQSLRLKIELGKSSEELLVAVGGFYNHTGGNWIFVVNEAEKVARKRSIQLGRKNAQSYQVLEGLEVGERVITSSYDSFGDKEVLVW